MRYLFSFTTLGSLVLIFAACDQNPIEELAELSIPITNNAVCGVVVDGKEYVYSFGGLGAGKTHEDITLRSFRLDVQANIWTEIDPLPDTMPKIAAAASVVKGKIYIIGGYHVFPDGHEKSSPKVHVFDPVKNQYLDNAADVPTPIDDQVQAVWQDSLIYVITGWSDSLNVDKVQVFKPEANHWHYGTSLPDEYSYNVFGGSGTIVGNTIYYAGGAGNRQNKNFPIQSYIRTGQINPENPLDIKWSTAEIENAGIYRSGAFNINNKPAWIGGADLSYNYNGISYTKKPVEPLSQILIYDEGENTIGKSPIQIPAIMDMRGVAQFNGFIIICGGIEANQKVTNRTIKVRI